MATDKIRIRFEQTAVCCNRVNVPGDEQIVDAKVADRMVERNLATVVHRDPADTDPHEQHADELTGMTAEELKEYADEAGVDLTGITDEAEMVAAIRKAM